jgi:hypothetical protein
MGSVVGESDVRVGALVHLRQGVLVDAILDEKTSG